MIPTYSLRMGAYQLHLAALPTVAALLMLALLLSAGLWQLQRADEKRAVEVEQAYRVDKPVLILGPDTVASASLEPWRHRLARARGHYVGDRQYLLDNRTHNHAAGYHVLTLLRLENSDVHLLVNRGWLPVGPDRRQLPDVTVAKHVVNPNGMIVGAPASGLLLGASGYDDGHWPRVVQHLDLDRLEAQLGEPLLPFVLRLSPDAEFGYARAWEVRMGLSPERHVGYAVQWFALAAALIALCLWVAVKRQPREHHGR